MSINFYFFRIQTFSRYLSIQSECRWWVVAAWGGGGGGDGGDSRYEDEAAAVTCRPCLQEADWQDVQQDAREEHCSTDDARIWLVKIRHKQNRLKNFLIDIIFFWECFSFQKLSFQWNQQLIIISCIDYIIVSDFYSVMLMLNRSRLLSWDFRSRQLT